MLKIKKKIIIIISIILILFLLKFLYCEIKIYLNKDNFYVDTYKRAKNYYDNKFFYDNNILYFIINNDLYFYNLKTKNIIRVIKNIYKKIGYKNTSFKEIIKIKNNQIYIFDLKQKILFIYNLNKLTLQKKIKFKFTNIFKNNKFKFSRLIRIDMENKIHIYDNLTNKIYIFDYNGNYIKSYGEINIENKSFFPAVKKIYLTKNNIYILSFNNKTNKLYYKIEYYINKYDLNGNLLEIQTFKNNKLGFLDLNYIELGLYKYLSNRQINIKKTLEKIYLNKKNNDKMLGEIPNFIHSKKNDIYLIYRNKIIKYNYKTKKAKYLFRIFNDYLCSKTNATKYLYKHLKNDKKTLFFWYSQLGFFNYNNPANFGNCIFLKDFIIVPIAFFQNFECKQIFYKMDYDGNNRKLIKLNLPTKKILKDNNQKILKEKIDNYFVYLKYKFFNFFYKLR